MRGVTDWLRGWCELVIDGADLQGCLNHMTAAGIPFWCVRFEDEFTLRVCIYMRNLDFAEKIIWRSMCDLKSMSRFGLPEAAKHIKQRIPLLIFLLTIPCVLGWFSSRIWFFSVEGNDTIPAEMIVRAVNDCGVPVGTRRKTIDPQIVKDRVLEKLPELSWLTVTQNGCSAKIVVREKQAPDGRDDRRAVRNLVASQSGVIEALEVLDGSAAVRVGDTVKQGDLLISGYMDLEYKIRATRAEGEVYARTWRNLKLKSPLSCHVKQYSGQKKKKFSLIFGKYQIKLSSSSGIFAGGCDKMTEYIPVTFPGGLKLPIILVKETYSLYDKQPHNLDANAVGQMLTDAARHRVERSMVAGKIQNHTEEIAEKQQIAELEIQFECREMIASPAQVGIFKEE